MTRWNDVDPVTKKPDWRLGVAEMVRHGIREFDHKRCEGLRFDCWNEAETTLVCEMMAKRPDIPYSTNRMARSA